LQDLIAREPVSKPKGRPKKPGGEGTQVRIDPDVVSKARYVAAMQHVTLSELLSEWLRPIADREFRRAGKKLFEGEK
jgi:predicted HicB family RNase H-like nuclease